MEPTPPAKSAQGVGWLIRQPGRHTQDVDGGDLRYLIDSTQRHRQREGRFDAVVVRGSEY